MTSELDGFYQTYRDVFLPGTDIAESRVEALTPLLEHYLAKPAGRVLDLCCGGGIFTFALADHGWDVLGVDVQEPLLEIARNHARETGASVDFRKGDATALILEDESFSACVLLGNSIPHFGLDDLGRVAAEIRRVLKPEGPLIVDYYDFLQQLLQDKREVAVEQTGAGALVSFYAGYDGQRGTSTRLYQDLGNQRIFQLEETIWYPALLRCVVTGRGFELEQSHPLGSARYVDVFRRCA